MSGPPRRARQLIAGVVGAMLVSLALAAQKADPALISQAEELLRGGKAAQSYALLVSRSAEFSGDPRYDYTLSLAALDSGKPREAIAPLRRLLDIEPRFVAARMELGRALFDSGDYAAAQQQFDYLLGQNPSDSMRAVIERYVQSVKLRQPVSSRHFAALLEFGAGYDSNANGASNDAQFLGFILNPRFVEQASSTAELSGAAEFSQPLGARSGVASTWRITHRANPDANFVDQTVVAGTAAYRFHVGAARGSAGVSAYYGWLDGKPYERGVNIEFGISRWLSNDWEWAALLRAGPLQYPQTDLKALDVNRYLAGMSLTRYNIAKRGARLGVAMIGGRDSVRRNNSPYGNNRRGLRLSGGYPLRLNASLYGELSYIDSDFRAAGGFFGIDRRDQQSLAAIALEFRNWPRQRWSISPLLRYTDSSSNVSLFKFRRTEAMVYLKYSFD